MPKTVAVVLHYEKDELTNQCVDSILETSPEVSVLVVDNHSPHPFFNEFSDSQVTVIRNDNRYAVSGMNAGFYHALYRMNADFVMNFDNDVICLPGWLEPLLRVMEDPKVGVCGGRQWDKEQKLHRQVGLDLVGGHLILNGPVEQREVVWIQGSAVLMRGEMMRRIGLHDDRFKIMCSDSDYCIHAKDRGWRVVFTPDSNVIHIGNSSYQTVCETWERDNKQLLQKWSGMKFIHDLGSFPLDSRNNRFLSIKYDVVEGE